MNAYEPSSRNGPGDLTGAVLSDRYRLEEQIGSGGMGTVWRATDTLLNRSVAVKLLHPAQMAEPTARGVLEEQDASAICFDDQGVTWRDHRLSLEDLLAARDVAIQSA